MFQDPAACVLEYLDYHTVAEGYGGRGLLLGGGGGGGDDEEGDEEEGGTSVGDVLARVRAMHSPPLPPTRAIGSQWLQTPRHGDPIVLCQQLAAAAAAAVRIICCPVVVSGGGG
eukprot:COSAG01_NODE_8414_length_2791_cov_2.495171_2_plen_114_part_00